MFKGEQLEDFFFPFLFLTGFDKKQSLAFNHLSFSSKNSHEMFWWSPKKHDFSAEQGIALFWYKQGLPETILCWVFRFISYPQLPSCCASHFQLRGCVSQCQEGQCFSGASVLNLFFIVRIFVNDESFTQINILVFICHPSAAAECQWKKGVVICGALWGYSQRAPFQKSEQKPASWLPFSGHFLQCKYTPRAAKILMYWSNSRKEGMSSGEVKVRINKWQTPRSSSH